MDPKHLCGGFTGRFLQHWKSQSLARVSKNCVLLGYVRRKKLSKISLIFWKKSFYHSFGTLCWSTSLFTFTSSRAFSVAWQLLAARSPCCAVLIFVDLAFLSGMNARWKFISDFLPRAIDTTCVHTQSWLWSSPLQANKFSSSMIHFLMRQLLCLWQGGVCLCTISHEVRSVFDLLNVSKCKKNVNVAWR